MKLIFFIDDKCSRFKISESLSNGLSEFLLIPDGNNKEKIASLLTLILSSKSVNVCFIWFKLNSIMIMTHTLF